MIISIIVTILLVFYGGILIMSPMMIASQGFSDSLSSIITALVFLGYPVIIFLLMTIFNLPFYGMASFKWLIGFSVLFLVTILIYRIPQLIINIKRGIPNTGYYIGEEAVYLNGSAIEKADPNSFDPMKDVAYYSKDAHHVFYHKNIIPDSDPSTFMKVPSENEDGHGNYWKDKNQVYLDGHILKGADPKTMVVLNSLYAKDAKQMYYNGKILPDANPETFYFLSDGIGLDRENAYVYGKKSTTKTDIKTLEVVDTDQSTSFLRDKNSIYFIIFHHGDPLLKVEGADPKTFEYMERGYSKDAHHVFYHDSNSRQVKVLQEADPATFTVGYDNSTQTEARDKNHSYMNGETVAPNQ
ncbi:DKNYY domain-containing protein [Fulvivirga sediminis]|uniref:DKNYY domain-containing protein n=1 Tax=Fulvivirga sediminis TaxID=2803949 RepID=A0A937FBZ2_9BACT|nr:DKNYY domain-containing protein [Fulvivirga sediminis]MBL3658394.1 DKNYY domain-containing protein [Fulvivirga sediminis]